MADDATTVTLEFLAGRIERVLDEMGQLRDDMRVMSAMIQRHDGTLQGLTNEVRAHHARFDRLDCRVRKLEGRP